MVSRVLQGAGVLAILGLVAGSVAALLVVKDRIRVTLAAEEEASKRGIDPVELLRADVGAVAGDVAALNQNLGRGLQELHEALEGSATEREKELSARIDALEAGLAALQDASTQNDAAFAAALKAQTEALANASLHAPAQDVAVPTPVTEQAPTVEEREPEPAVPEAAAPPKKSFLGFQLPSASFVFDQRQRFAIVPSLSRVGFDAKSTLHDFSGVTSKVEGELTVNLARAGENPAGTVAVETASLDTGLAGRDEDMRKTLAVEQHRSITFEWTGFTASAVDAAAMTVAGNATGKLSIRGKTREVTMPVQVSVDASKRLAIEGELMIKLSDYKVAPPTQLVGTIKVDDDLKLWISLRARPIGAAEEGG